MTHSSSELVQAPGFDLYAANGVANARVRLAQLLQRGPAILEFLRGTW